MMLLVGLGNPGFKYESTRHNIGFRVVTRLAEQAGQSISRARFKGLTADATWGQEKVLFLLPQTFMNLSGESVAEAARFFGVEVPSIVVVHDELDIPFGHVRLKKGGGHAGHNGLRSLIDCLGSNDFVRVRVGVGRPPGRQPVIDFVLSDFSLYEKSYLDDVILRAHQATESILNDGLTKAMAQFHALPPVVT
ncbi:MAG: aminoacyl-tRNA hydrolase [Myxococcota bacterium]